jgi:hypothetical protein
MLGVQAKTLTPSGGSCCGEQNTVWSVELEWRPGPRGGMSLTTVPVEWGRPLTVLSVLQIPCDMKLCDNSIARRGAPLPLHPHSPHSLTPCTALHPRGPHGGFRHPTKEWIWSTPPLDVRLTLRRSRCTLLHLNLPGWRPTTNLKESVREPV